MKITKQNYEEYAIDYIEGTLSKEDRVAFGHFLSCHPEIAAEIGALQEDLPVLYPDLSVRYEDKDRLKRRASIRPWIRRIGRVAAILVLGLWAFDRVRNTETEGNPGDRF